MLKYLSASLLILAMTFISADSTAYAQKGRSYSSGSSSKPSSSSSSTSSKSYSSGSSGKSYSSGSSSTKPFGSGYATQPTATGSGGKKYSSGSPPSTSPQPKSTPPAATSPSGKKYSSGSPPTAVDPPSTPGKKYSSGSPPPGTGPPVKSGDGNSRKPSGSGFNNAMATDAKHQESKVKYEAATAPKATYTTRGADGKVIEKPLKADSPQVKTVRNYVTHERYVTYEHRATVFYGPYYGHPVYYHDYYSPFLMGWLLSDAINSHDRALWMYHHQYDMDQARYAELLRRDAKLQAEIDALKAQNIARDAGYVPPQMADNPDLMFSQDFVNASYNPQEVETNTPAQGGSGAGTFFFWLFVVFAVLVVGGILVYFLFMKEY